MNPLLLQVVVTSVGVSTSVFVTALAIIYRYIDFVFFFQSGFGGLWGGFWRGRGGGRGNWWRRSCDWLSWITEERYRRIGITEQTSEVNLNDSIFMGVDLFDVSMFLEIIGNTTFLQEWKTSRRTRMKWSSDFSARDTREGSLFPSFIKSLKKNCIVGTVWDLKDIFLDQVEHFG